MPARPDIILISYYVGLLHKTDTGTGCDAWQVSLPQVKKSRNSDLVAGSQRHTLADNDEIHISCSSSDGAVAAAVALSAALVLCLCLVACRKQLMRTL